MKERERGWKEGYRAGDLSFDGAATFRSDEAESLTLPIFD